MTKPFFSGTDGQRMFQEAGRRAQIEQLATIRASEMIDEQRKKWIEGVREQISAFTADDMSAIGTSDRIIERVRNILVGEILSLPALQKGDK